MRYIEVILPLPLPGYFTYALKDDVQNDLIGCRVIVPFGKRKIYTGIVANEIEHKPTFANLKEVLDVLDVSPIINKPQLRFLKWISDYYMCAIGDVYNAALPTNLKLSSESYISLLPDIEVDTQQLTDHEFNVLQYLRKNELSTEEVRQITGLKSPYRVIKGLREKGIVHLYEKLKDKYAPKTEKRVRIRNEIINSDGLQKVTDQLEPKPKQLDVILSYLKLVDIFENPELNQHGIAVKDLKNDGVSESSLKTLVKNGIMETWDQVIDRFQLDTASHPMMPELSITQSRTYEKILEEFDQQNVVLFKGITGSGKTEIYIRLIREQIEMGNTVLYLLPEIALTTQIIKRFRKVFGNRFGIYHSRFSDNERAETYQKCLDGEFEFIIGVRSSIFLPFNNLSLIIVDEEHESSYKQFDPAPRYHARDAAIYLAHIHSAKVLLGSATPALESYHNALDGKYGYVTLDERFEYQPLPEIQFADLVKARKQRRMKGHTSSELLEAIQISVSQGKQVMLFQNRRGYAPFLQCDNCQNVPKCINCSVSMTYHIYQNQLVCHYCGYKQFHDPSCPSCGQERLRTMGAGTEMIEEELSTLLPDVKFKRMDLDTTRNKYSYQKLIDAFEDGSIQVLIGTQMISKGLDFEHVNLVGIYDADRMIHFPDFRSHERAFQMITQVSGRSGRKHERGTVIIQTTDPTQEILQHVKEGHLDLFYRDELEKRKEYKFPPFFRLIKVIIRDREKPTSFQAANQLGILLKKELGNRVMDPIEPIIGKIRNQYLHEIQIRLEKERINLPAVKDFLQASTNTLLALPSFKSVLIHFDVDPL